MSDFFVLVAEWFPRSPGRGKFLQYSDFGAVEDRMKHYSVLLGTAIFVTMMGAVLNCSIYYYNKTYGGKFPALWLKTRPLALGVGLAWYEVSWRPSLGNWAALCEECSVVAVQLTSVSLLPLGGGRGHKGREIHNSLQLLMCRPLLLAIAPLCSLRLSPSPLRDCAPLLLAVVPIF